MCGGGRWTDCCCKDGGYDEMRGGGPTPPITDWGSDSCCCCWCLSFFFFLSLSFFFFFLATPPSPLSWWRFYNEPQCNNIAHKQQHTNFVPLFLQSSLICQDLHITDTSQLRYGSWEMRDIVKSPSLSHSFALVCVTRFTVPTSHCNSTLCITVTVLARY